MHQLHGLVAGGTHQDVARRDVVLLRALVVDEVAAVGHHLHAVAVGAAIAHALARVAGGDLVHVHLVHVQGLGESLVVHHGLEHARAHHHDVHVAQAVIHHVEGLLHVVVDVRARSVPGIHGGVEVGEAEVRQHGRFLLDAGVGIALNCQLALQQHLAHHPVAAVLYHRLQLHQVAGQHALAAHFRGQCSGHGLTEHAAGNVLQLQYALGRNGGKLNLAHLVGIAVDGHTARVGHHEGCKAALRALAVVVHRALILAQAAVCGKGVAQKGEHARRLLNGFEHHCRAEKIEICRHIAFLPSINRRPCCRR